VAGAGSIPVTSGWQDGPVPTSPPHPAPSRRARPALSRRALFRWSTITVTGAVTVGLTACAATDDEPEPDPLLSAAARARTDAATATALAATTPDLADALTAIADERAAHAEALDTEISRAAGVTDSTAPPPTTTAPAPTGPAPSVEELRARLTDSQRGAADLARTQRGFRAGLLGSISAACAAHTEVLLP